MDIIWCRRIITADEVHLDRIGLGLLPLESTPFPRGRIVIVVWSRVVVVCCAIELYGLGCLKDGLEYAIIDSVVVLED